jgi:hypothetical protein
MLEDAKYMSAPNHTAQRLQRFEHQAWHLDYRKLRCPPGAATARSLAQAVLCDHPPDGDHLVYGGAYAYGRTGAVARYSGSPVGTKSRRKPRGEWLALKPGAYEGYLD